MFTRGQTTSMNCINACLFERGSKVVALLCLLNPSFDFEIIFF